MPVDPNSTPVDDASDDDEDYVSPAERAEALRLFRRGAWRGPSPAVLRDASLRADRAVRFLGREYVSAHEPSRSSPTVTDRIRRPELPSVFTSPGFILTALGAVVLGAIIGHYWRKRRQAQAPDRKPLHGLDVLGASR